MRLTRLIPVLAVPMLAAACAQDAPTALDSPQFSEHAGAPVGQPFTVQFPAFNPCTNQGILVTNTGTIWIQPHPNNRVIRVKGTTTSSDGYTGSYNETWTGSNLPGPAGPGDTSIRTINTQVTNSAGSRYMVHLVWVIDFKTSPPTWRVDRFSATCVIP